MTFKPPFWTNYNFVLKFCNFPGLSFPGFAFNLCNSQIRLTKYPKHVENAPSTLSVHQFELSGHVLDWGISAMKSAKTCPFFYSLGLYWMSYSLSSISQLAILPKKSGLWSVLQRGRSVSTTMGCAWKYEWSFLAAIRRAKAACSR